MIWHCRVLQGRVRRGRLPARIICIIVTYFVFYVKLGWAAIIPPTSLHGRLLPRCVPGAAARGVHSRRRVLLVRRTVMLALPNLSHAAMTRVIFKTIMALNFFRTSVEG